MKRIRQLTVAMSIVAAMMFNSAMALSPKREMRSTWFTTVWGIDWPSTQGATSSAQTKQKAEMISYLDGFANSNMNGSCFQVRSMADAMYPSKLAPWSSYLSGTRGKDPGWDPLAYFVEESHKRGLEAYVWLNPYRWSTGTTWSTSFDKEWLNNDMIIAGTKTTSYKTFNPALPETRKHIVDVVVEILENYNIDGILFDDYFYASGGTSENSSAPDYEDYKASGTTMSIGDWRRANVNQMVKDVYEAIQESRPDVRFGISPAGVAGTSSYSKYGVPSPSSYGIKSSDWQYAQIYSDPLAWLKAGTIDFISPQMYWPTTHSTAPYEPLAKWWSYVGNYFGRHFYASQESADLGDSGELSNDATGWAEMAKQTEFTRKYNENNAPGIIYYSAKYINGPGKTGLGDYMKANSFTHKSLTPVVTWKTKTNYGKVANLTSTGSTLTWDAVSNGNAIIRYTVYAIPAEFTLTDVQMVNGDGISNEYLLGVSYANSYSIPSDKQGDFYYAVCIYDGYGNEFEPAVAGYPEGESTKVTLVSPVKGETASAWTIDFAWSAVNNATYTMEISDNKNFTNVLIQNKSLTTNKVNVDLSQLEESKTYYWRVSCAESGKLPSVSDIETFVTPTRPYAPVVTLVSPANGVDFDDNFEFKWKGVDVDSYELQVSTQQDFATIKYKKEIVAGVSTITEPMVISLLGKGTFYWRVLSKDSHMKTSSSEVHSFTITRIAVGNFEPGYSVVLDKDSYATIEDLEFTSLWFRSVMDDYKNITFGEDGKLNRGFCAIGDYVYLAGRTENSSSSTIYLRKIDGMTGEIISDIILGDEGKVSYYPCNDVIKDSKGNVCISNLSLGISSTPLKIYLVDLETGALTEIASLTKSGLSSSRVDHISILGDVVEGDFTVFAAISKSNAIVQCVFEEGEEVSSITTTLKSFYPASASAMGIAPFVIPITADDIFVVGGDIHMSRYDFSTGKLTDSFANKVSLTPEGFEINGGAYFTLNNQNYLIYPYSDYNTKGYAYNLTKVNSNYDFSSMELMWEFPKGSIGSVNSTTYQAEVDYVLEKDGVARIYVYVPGNGIAAYQLNDTSVSGIEDVLAQDMAISVEGSTIKLGKVADSVLVYSLYGIQLANASKVSAIDMNVVPGVYVVEVHDEGNVITKKVIVK
ncbi:MAG: family 10 glycosylhydrolase [Muribaculaceae bacterium]|nr:family 10 glycosylhydrolase [Muribaculaceae bacterium]